MYNDIVADLQRDASPKKAKASAWFFKTGKGQYGYGDVFIGLTVPEQRTIAKKYVATARFPLLKKLLQSKIHEYRLTALLILVAQYEKAETGMQKQIYEFYLENIDRVNNWDLVDLSACRIMGHHLEGKNKAILKELAHDSSVWKRRIAVLTTFYSIGQGKPEHGLRIAEMLVNDKHDLIQKAVGWMLREVGKRCSLAHEERFLERHAATMPRTALRYAIERMSPEKKQYFMTRSKAVTAA
jgi:3-methyladenine DNA glycosylase AlkD